eukprot:371836-Amphidinium_carterae.1
MNWRGALLFTTGSCRTADPHDENNGDMGPVSYDTHECPMDKMHELLQVAFSRGWVCYLQHSHYQEA